VWGVEGESEEMETGYKGYEQIYGGCIRDERFQRHG
jgi:hypothetical protein